MISISEFNSGFADKFFNKTYNTPSGSLKIFLLSAISGYPMGAKLICSFYNQGNLNNRQAESLMALCSVCGPTFILGTVGVSILKSYKAGIIILIANVLSALVNGLIFKNKKENLNMKPCIHKKSDFSLSDIVYDSLLSILMIAGFVCLSFVFIDILKFCHVLSFLSNIISCVCFNKINPSVVEAVLSGSLEMTRGLVNISNLCNSLKTKTILASSIVGFGGLSVMLQSLSFVSTLKIKFGKFLLQKFIQAILCFIITIILVSVAF